MAATKFSDYLGLKQYKKAKNTFFFNHLDLAYRNQSLEAEKMRSYQKGSIYDSVSSFSVDELGR